MDHQELYNIQVPYSISPDLHISHFHSGSKPDEINPLLHWNKDSLLLDVLLLVFCTGVVHYRWCNLCVPAEEGEKVVDKETAVLVQERS